MVPELVEEEHFGHRTQGIPFYGNRRRLWGSSMFTGLDGAMYLITWHRFNCQYYFAKIPLNKKKQQQHSGCP